MRETRNLLNLHLLFWLRISAKSWTAFCRDRIAPTCTIRHPVCPIVALQRRMRFSARLAGFCRGRWHQRRARKAERASFSVLVSNLDFRVPRLRQSGERAADRAMRAAEKRPLRDPESRPGIPRRGGLARSGPGVAPAFRDVHLSPGDQETLRAVCGTSTPRCSSAIKTRGLGSATPLLRPAWRSYPLRAIRGPP